MPRYHERLAVTRRAIQTYQLLQTERPTLTRLAERLGVSERTARRYIEALQAAHVPVRRYGPHYRIEGV